MEPKFIQHFVQFFNITTNSFYTTIFLTLCLAIIIFYYKSKRTTIYLLDYACYKAPPSLRVAFSSFIEHSRIVFKNNPLCYEFQQTILERSGLGDETSLPQALSYLPPIPTHSFAIEEAQLVIFSSIDQLLKKVGIKPQEIDILITNCSLFCPCPSLSSMIVNKYNMKPSIRTFSLSGMGCSAGAISIDLASNILKVTPNSYALIVSTEIITPNSYMGSERSMVVPGCLFRMGCSSILLTNKESESYRCKYRLMHIIRTHKGSDNVAYKCVTQEEDLEGKLGVALTKELLVVAGDALKSNLTSLGPLVLPLSENLKFALIFIARKIFRHTKIKPYVPKFNKVFDHLCLHAGGRAVINAIQKNLDLKEEQVEASRMTLYRFGNTSSSSIWYELSYNEAKGKMKKGDLIWQIAFGSGFKCNSMVWKCNRNVDVLIDGFGPWKDCINKFPVSVPKIRML